MAREILSIKLSQLDDRVAKLHQRIRMSETASHAQLQKEIRSLRQDCIRTEESLRENLQHSKSALTTWLAKDYGQMEAIIRRSRAQLEAEAQSAPGSEALAEEQLLLAEYALDFAHQAADRALLLSMEAIDTQLLAQQEGGTP